VQHEAECESAADGVPEPVQVSCRIRPRRGVGFDFNSDDPAIAELDEYVHFVPAVESHVSSVFAKLGIVESPESSRRVLAVLAYLQA
jgi:hypothetical protein